MRRSLMLSAAVLALIAGPARAVSPGVTTDTSPPMSGGAAPVGDAGMSGMRPMHGQARHAAPHATPRPAAQVSDRIETDAPNRAYRGGSGSPSSSAAANTTSANTRSQIAPRLPDPGAETNTTEAYLMAARRALSRGQTGAAQEALERAETRALTRSTEPALAGSPDSKPVVQQISSARQALANRDVAGARTAIAQALGDGGGLGTGPETRANGVPR